MYFFVQIKLYLFLETFLYTLIYIGNTAKKNPLAYQLTFWKAAEKQWL